MTRIVAALAMCFSLTSACADPVSPSRASTFLPAPGISQAPSELPHILRFEGRIIAGWPDLRRNTAIIIGAPADPAQSRLCGGTERNQFMPIQFVGDLEAVVKQLLQSQDARVLVYDELAETLEEALCTMTPAGSGVGLYLRSDNDFFGTGGHRANGFSEHVAASLVMADGSKGHVAATLHGLGQFNQLVFIKTSVVITPTPR